MLLQNQNFSFIPAVLRENVDWYIEYSFRDSNGKLVRVRNKLNRVLKRFRTKSERRAYALEEVTKLNSKLSRGWTPIYDRVVASNSFAATPFEEVCVSYLSYLEKAEATDDLAHATKLTYQSTFGIFKNFINSSPDVTLKYIYQLNDEVIRSWMNWATITRKVSRTTLCNYRRWLHNFCEWLVSCGYLKENPTKEVKLPNINHRKQREEDAIKSKYIDEHTRLRIFEWLDANDHWLKLAVLMCHICFLRPKEIASMKIEYIKLHESLIFVPKEVSKNKTDAYITLPDEVGRLMLDLKLFDYPGHYYIFNRQLMPEGREKPCRGDEIRERWRQMCRSIGISDKVWLYHMKHTGITDMTETMPEKLVQLQARHHSIQMTERYVQKKKPMASPLIKQFKDAQQKGKGEPI